MSVTEGQLRYSSHCPSLTVLAKAEVAWLESIPGADNEVPEDFNCELEPGHPGRHVAGVQSVGATGAEYWAWWDDSGTREIAAADPCEEREGHVRTGEAEPWLCLLPAGHSGRHFFA